MRSLGKYQLIEQIGIGGFGEVWKGFDPYIKRHVAVKTCSSDSEDMRTRFFQEAEIAGNLHHKNITTVYDFGVQESLPYLIQEYLTGEDLDRKVKRRDFLPYPEKLYYLLQIARGLAYAHSRGVIHRDVKPANIRILEDGTAKIMDFGIAKLQQQETVLTQTGMTLGTAAYLAPEQIMGESVSTATDVFSFGVLAYELLTYHRPFPGEQISAVLYALLHTAPKPMHEHWPAAPEDIVELIDRCLTKDSAGRFASGGELQRALELIQKQGAIERSGGIVAPGPAADTQRPLVTQPPPSTDPTPTPTPTRLDEMEITVVGSGAVPTPTLQPAIASDASELHREPTPGDGGTPIEVAATKLLPRQPPPKPNSRVPWIIVAVLAVFAGVGGWWLGSRADDTQGDSAAARSRQTTPDPVPADQVSATQDQDQTSDPESTSGALPSDLDGPETAVQEPIRARLVVGAPSWTDDMTLRVDSGIVRALVSRQEIPLDAGRHVLEFAIDANGFTAQSRQVVQLAEGERLVVTPEIREPATLSVRAMPSTPQGFVSVDGGVPVQTPVSGLFLSPGSRTIEITARSAAADGTTATLRQTLDFTSGERMAITFDLVAGELNIAGR
ncbi:MAG: serine/threonine protein kinase [Thermoanaerobaculia bacterium]|nr:serine/threonine protein kinase [Thermoanaerobaculia bacterium]